MLRTPFDPGAAARADARAARLRAASLARMLDPLAAAAGGFASCALVVEVGGRRRRPALVVALAEPPVDGVLRAPPLVVAEHEGDPGAWPPQEWLTAGAAAVWRLCPRAAEVWTPDGPARLVATGGPPALPEPIDAAARLRSPST